MGVAAGSSWYRVTEIRVKTEFAGREIQVFADWQGRDHVMHKKTIHLCALVAGQEIVNGMSVIIGLHAKVHNKTPTSVRSSWHDGVVSVTLLLDGVERTGESVCPLQHADSLAVAAVRATQQALDETG